MSMAMEILHNLDHPLSSSSAPNLTKTLASFHFVPVRCKRLCKSFIRLKISEHIARQNCMNLQNLIQRLLQEDKKESRSVTNFE